MISEGDLVQVTKGRYKGDRGIVVKGRYTHRFMDREDREMVAHGMGHLAGRYGAAVDVVFPTGRRAGQTVRLDASHVGKVGGDV